MNHFTYELHKLKFAYYLKTKLIPYIIFNRSYIWNVMGIKFSTKYKCWAKYTKWGTKGNVFCDPVSPHQSNMSRHQKSWLFGYYSCFLSRQSLVWPSFKVTSPNWQSCDFHWYLFYTISLCNFVVLTHSVWSVILFQETGMVHWITFSFSDFLFFTLFNLFLI